MIEPCSFNTTQVVESVYEIGTGKVSVIKGDFLDSIKNLFVNITYDM